MGHIRQLELDVRDDPSVLLRVVSTCHKRGIAISSLHYDPAACGGQILLRVRSNASGADRLGRWLAAIVPVLEVREGAPQDWRSPQRKPPNISQSHSPAGGDGE